MSINMTVTAAILLVTFSTGWSAPAEASQPTSDTAAWSSAGEDAGAVRRLWERHEAILNHEAQMQELMQRRQEGDEQALQTKLFEQWQARPTYEGLEDDALKVLDADGSDAAAFVAIEALLSTVRVTPANLADWSESPAAALHARLADLLIEHHMHRQRFASIWRNVFWGGNSAAACAYYEKVYRKSADAGVRSAALYSWTRELLKQLNSPGLDEVRRRALEKQVRAGIRDMRSQYGDDQHVAERAAHLEAALKTSSGAVLPDVEASNLAGEIEHLSDYRGKVLLLDFWFVQCGWCIRAHPELIEFRREMEGRPFEIIGVSVDLAPQDVIGYMREKTDLPWVNWYTGPRSALTEAWGVHSFPTYLLVDAEGVVRGRTNHFDAHWKEAIRKLVAGK